MSRERLTRRGREAGTARGILAEIDTLERAINADDASLRTETKSLLNEQESDTGLAENQDPGLVSDGDALATEEKAITDYEGVTDKADDVIDQWTDKLSDEEKVVVQQSMDVSVKDEGDQNAKMQENWPLSAAESEKMAKSLVALAKAVLESD